ncbi:MAG TPA: hypothetical protein IAB55_00440 [Candidatus Merdivicinus faecavium]|nr:hypothetical protein [Candidatus Merdivicinus faecavium]
MISLFDTEIQKVCVLKCGFADYFVAPHRELQDGIYHDSLIMGIRK